MENNQSDGVEEQEDSCCDPKDFEEIEEE